MKKYKWEIFWGIILIGFSSLIYSLHYSLFRDGRYIFEDLISQLAYLPIYIFLTTIVIDRLLNRRDKIETLRKLNTVVGLFFSEMGKELIKYLIKFDVNFYSIKYEFTSEWTEEKCARTRELLKNYQCKIDSKVENIEELAIFLDKNSKFLTSLMGNPNLIENEDFTELLIALFHLSEELKSREGLASLNDKDYKHLSNDIERVYSLLIYEWIVYMGHLKKEYPFLYSFALRTNPFLSDQKVPY